MKKFDFAQWQERLLVIPFREPRFLIVENYIQYPASGPSGSVAISGGVQGRYALAMLLFKFNNKSHYTQNVLIWVPLYCE